MFAIRRLRATVPLSSRGYSVPSTPAQAKGGFEAASSTGAADYKLAHPRRRPPGTLHTLLQHHLYTSDFPCPPSYQLQPCPQSTLPAGRQSKPSTTSSTTVSQLSSTRYSSLLPCMTLPTAGARWRRACSSPRRAEPSQNPRGRVNAARRTRWSKRGGRACSLYDGDFTRS